MRALYGVQSVLRCSCFLTYACTIFLLHFRLLKCLHNFLFSVVWVCLFFSLKTKKNAKSHRKHFIYSYVFFNSIHTYLYSKNSMSSVHRIHTQIVHRPPIDFLFHLGATGDDTILHSSQFEIGVFAIEEHVNNVARSHTYRQQKEKSCAIGKKLLTYTECFIVTLSIVSNG